MGANMAFRREWLERLSFNANLGRMGDSLISADEVDLMNRLRANGAMGFWIGQARLRHYVGSERLNARYIRRWYEGYGRTVVRCSQKAETKTLLGLPRWILREYLFSLARQVASIPLRNTSWLKGLTRTAYCRGYADEWRAKRTSNPSQPERSKYPLEQQGTI